MRMTRSRAAAITVGWIVVLFFIALAVARCDAQTPASPQKKSVKIDALDIAWAGTVVGDRLSTNYVLDHCPTCYEASPIKHNGVRMGVQFGLIGATKFLEYKYPGHSTAFRVFKGLMVGMGTAVIIHNLRK